MRTRTRPRPVAFALLPLALLAAAGRRFADMDEVMTAVTEARAAIAGGDGRAAVQPLADVLEVAPDHPGILFALARARALTGDRAGALTALERAADSGFALDAPGDPALRTLAGTPRFERAFARIRENRRPVAAARERFTLSERDLIPEGIAWDFGSRRVFVSSLYRRKVVVIAADGSARDLVPEGAGGLWQVLGMKVDAARGRILVCSAAERTMRGFTEADRGRSGLFSFDLATGALLSKWLVPPDGRTHLFNDLAIAPDATIFVTDSEEGSVWRIGPAGLLERYLPARSFLYPNGIALSPDGRLLYVASFSGVDRVDVATSRRAPLPHPRDVTLCGIDGLSFVPGPALVGVQNGLRPARVALFPLSPRFDRVVGARVLDRLDPLVTDPTTAVAAGDQLLLIANAQLGAFDADGKIFPDQKLEPVRIVSVPLPSLQRVPVAGVTIPSKP